MSDLRDRLDAEIEKIFGVLPGAVRQPPRLESAGAAPVLSSTGGLEAIIVADEFRRPALIVRNSTFERPRSRTWQSILDPQRSRIERAIRSTGRLELSGHSSFDWVGTAWMIAEDIAITNRHVASLFARSLGRSGFPMLRGPGGDPMKARIDFREEFRVPTAFEIPVEKVLYIAEPGEDHPDVALLRLARERRLPDPIELFGGGIEPGRNVVVIGYPANDPRNPAAAVGDVFGGVFDVKRLSPGQILGPPDGFRIRHDCSTLGGNSGSVVLDVETGTAAGLHFGGNFRVANIAVSADQLKKILSKLKIQVPVGESLEARKKARKAAPQRAGGLFANRGGYRADFLGSLPPLRVPLPKPSSRIAGDIAPVKGAADDILRYTHFSIAMSRTRRLARFAAVNIDGRDGVHIRRTGDKWVLDPRIAPEHQVGDELYRDNDLDRGHLVRRLDPVWGEDAEQANSDTFVFTNATPQHAQLNQRTWNDLEEYVLGNTQAHELKVNVFTGPVLAGDDPEYRGVQLPQQFWKVVSLVHGGKLHATAYVLSQRDLISGLEFVFGQFRTFQVPVAEVERMTDLGFGPLRKADPLGEAEVAPVREIVRLEDIVL